MGSVLTTDAQITGGLEVQGDRALLLTNAGVTAYDHSARIHLQRGGQVLVCATSAFHLLRSGADDSLLFGLDRGALELLASSRPQDVLLTPDLRFTALQQGVFDLRMRVTRNGDTCVENRGSNAPVLQITEAFGDATYRLLPGQHVLFEHGSLREVVDNESSPCGCPAETPASSGAPIATASQGQAAAAQIAAAQHPFPAAQSEDLAAAQPVAQPSPSVGGGEAQTQVSASLAFKPGGAVADSTTPAAAAQPASASVATQATAPPPSPPGAKRIVHAIGNFFRKLFGGN
jgi:hypothetical protein